MSENESRQEAAATTIKFRFCRNCANLLYPGEDRENGGLIFECRHCSESERADSSCVFRNELSNTVGETAGITQDVGSDPTVCEDDGIPPMCTMCGQEIICEECGQPQYEGFLCLEVDENNQTNGLQREADNKDPPVQEQLTKTLSNLQMRDEQGQGQGNEK